MENNGQEVSTILGLCYYLSRGYSPKKRNQDYLKCSLDLNSSVCMGASTK